MNDRLSNIMLLVVQLILPSNDWSCHISWNLTVTEHALTYDLGQLVARSAPTYARPYETFCYRTIIRTTCRAIDCNRSQKPIAACDRNSVSHQTFTIGCMYFKSTKIARPKKSYDPVWLKPYREALGSVHLCEKLPKYHEIRLITLPSKRSNIKEGADNQTTWQNVKY